MSVKYGYEYDSTGQQHALRSRCVGITCLAAFNPPIVFSTLPAALSASPSFSSLFPENLPTSSLIGWAIFHRDHHAQRLRPIHQLGVVVVKQRRYRNGRSC